jgi:hypothetical protein
MTKNSFIHRSGDRAGVWIKTITLKKVEARRITHINVTSYIISIIILEASTFDIDVGSIIIKKQCSTPKGLALGKNTTANGDGRIAEGIKIYCTTTTSFM